jgi:hypothetical protein
MITAISLLFALSGEVSTSLMPSGEIGPRTAVAVAILVAFAVVDAIWMGRNRR